MGFWEQILDYFTRVDDILRQLLDEYKKGNAKLIEAITGVEPEPPDLENKHIPFFVEDTVASGDKDTLLIKDDPEQGLGGVGRSGYFINDSDEYVHIIIDSGKGKSNKIRIDGGERHVFDRSDNIWIDKLTIDASEARAAVDYRCSFSR
ncbi:unnamed protein product [marine sediment metagenome]|uniref:Uncharacterized protein n=1 Tax=marine sediment metagenome TaxID=412755 RepID=X1INS1_9ZZZZ